MQKNVVASSCVFRQLCCINGCKTYKHECRQQGWGGGGGGRGEGYSLYVIISRYMYHASLKGTVFGPVWSGLGKVIHLSQMVWKKVLLLRSESVDDEVLLIFFRDLSEVRCRVFSLV